MGWKKSVQATPGTIKPIFRDVPCFVTNVPRPCCRETSPCRSSSATTPVNRERLTPKRRDSETSLGNAKVFE